MQFHGKWGILTAVLVLSSVIGCGGGGSSSGEEDGRDVPLGDDGTASDSDASDGIPPDLVADADGSEVDALDAAPEVVDTADVSEADVPVTWPQIVINEVLVKAEGAYPDWIELTSLHGESVDLGGWGIRDELNAHDFLLPEGTKIDAFGFKVIWGKGGDQELTMDFGFKVDAKARLFTPDGELADETDWEDGDAPAGTSWGRFPNGTGEFQALDEPTQGKANKSPAAPDSEDDSDS